ncbi:hypothetical protein Clacol_005693 [Clathrus columnatus]|uniref:Uncharacterized protein n=1 Tax=Clathrus columnatus TaxID=1419009 RepID=A0AAV5AAU4_9AGAM|nr:hypothetical protein Clacol_005693 [Clathrus columnatus]
MFKFTFNIGSHLFNPFTAQAQVQSQVRGQAQTEERNTFNSSSSSNATHIGQGQPGTRRLPAPPRRCGSGLNTEEAVPEAEYDSCTGPTLTPLSRKRGWAPSSSSPSEPMSLTTSTNGWLDTPSRYVKAAASVGKSYKGTECDQDLPPAKRRKTITDSILSTALSAALIGTAVGMSAYRMWRDRGTPKQVNDPSVEEIIMDSPPPPYEQDDWVQAVVPQPRGKSMPVVSTTPQYHHHTASSPPLPASSLSSIPRTPKSARASKARRTARMARHRTTYAHAPASPRSIHITPSKTVPAYSNEPDPKDVEEEFDSHMDLMGDKIRKLIEEGQKALGKEVVIMNDDDRDNEEGAVDDGLDGWEEVDESSAAHNHHHLTHAQRIPGERRKKRRPSNANANGSFFIAPSTSLPSRLNNNDHTPIFHADRPVSPKQKRPRALTGTSRLGSPIEPPSVQVIYEPLELSTSSLSPETSYNFEDEDSLNLSQRMEKIRQAYRLQ